MKCRFCEHELNNIFIDLGNSPPSNSYLTSLQLNEPESYFPLKIFVCEKCFLVQVDEYKKATEIFDNQYAYFSSVSTSWLAHSKSYTEKMMKEFGINTKSFVIEIASNDGYLLQYFKEKGIKVLGIEPTASTAKIAIEKKIDTLQEFFGINIAKRLAKESKKADLLLGNNVLAHVPDINDFVKGLQIALNPEGIITMEFPHLLQLIENNQFDTIYHEHFSYLSFSTVKTIFEKHDLQLFHVEELSTHGGSLRIFAKHKSGKMNSIKETVASMLLKEKKFGINNLTLYKGFDKKVANVKLDFLEFLINSKKNGKKMVAYGAAAKGNTMLNFCGIKNDFIDFVVDAAPSKQGKYLPGSHIPIVEEAKIKETKPDYIIIFPWNIKTEIETQLAYVRNWGGQFVTAIPHLVIF
ncbi:MAG: methyltransferase domain-containing protein [Bacteroidota bacterium]